MSSAEQRRAQRSAGPCRRAGEGSRQRGSRRDRRARAWCVSGCPLTQRSVTARSKSLNQRGRHGDSAGDHWHRVLPAPSSGGGELLPTAGATDRRYRNLCHAHRLKPISRACRGTAPLRAANRGALCHLSHRLFRTDAVRPPLQTRRLHAGRGRLEGPALCRRAAAGVYASPDAAAGRPGARLRHQQRLGDAAGQPLYRRQARRPPRCLHPGNLRRRLSSIPLGQHRHPLRQAGQVR